MNLLTDEIYIYSKIVHRVQTWLTNDWIPLPKTANLDTLMVLGSSYTPISYQVIEPGHLYPEYEDVIIHKKGLTYSGKVLSNQNNTITLLQDDRIITISNYDSIEGKRPENLEPGIIVYENNGPSEVLVSYLMTGLSWNPNYNFIIDSDSTIVLMEIISSINNSTDTHFENVTVSLIAGDLNTPVMNVQPRALMAQAMAAAPVMTSDYDKESLDEYTKFNIGQQDLDVFTRVPLESWNMIPTEKIYWNILGEEDVTFGYRFNAPDFLPQGNAYVYVSDPNGRSVESFVGYSNIKETQKDDIVDLKIGRTSHVKIETEVQQNETTPPEQKRGHIYNVSISSHIKSNIDHDIYLILKFNIGDAKLRLITCPYIRKRGYLEFHLKLHPRDIGQSLMNEDLDQKPHSESTFTCKLEYSV